MSDPLKAMQNSCMGELSLDTKDLLSMLANDGAAYRTHQVGSTMAQLRLEYEKRVKVLLDGFEQRKAAGWPGEKLAKWISEERHNLAHQMRARQGIGVFIAFEIRDWKEYGPGGRTFGNIQSKYVRKFGREQAIAEIVRGATSPNNVFTEDILRSARYLKHGGRVLLPISISATAYTLLTTPDDQLEKVIYEETGSAALGSFGAGAGAAACLAFGLATSGWGLLGCAVIGGAVGGAGGAYAGNRLYYASRPTAEGTGKDGAFPIIDSSELTEQIPLWGP